MSSSAESGAIFRQRTSAEQQPLLGELFGSKGVSMRGIGAMREKVDGGAGVAVVYFAISLVTCILTKAIMTKFFFDYAIVIMMMQAAVTLFVLELARVCSIVKLLPYTFDRGKDMFIPSLMYSLQGYFSLTALQGMNLPTYDPVKKMVPMATLWVSYYALQRSKQQQPRPAKQVIFAVGLVCIGAMMATMYDWQLDTWSSIYGLIGLVFQAIYLTMIERYAANSTYTALEMVYMNSFNCLVLFLLADLWQDEIRDAFMYFMTSASSMFVFAFISMTVLACIMQFFMFACTTYASAVTTTVVGNLRASIQTFLGYYMAIYLFYDTVPTFTNGIGLLICMAGTAAYAYAKHTARGGMGGLQGSVRM